MSLRQKTLLLIGAIQVILIIVLFIALRTIIINGFTNLETTDAQTNVQRVLNTLDAEAASLASIGADWAHWDDTYEFLLGEYPEYIDDNMMDETFTNLGLDLVVLVNREDEVFYAKAFDRENEVEGPVPEYVDEYFAGNSPVLQLEDLESHHTGIYMLPDGPMLLTAMNVLTSQYEGPRAGVQIFGRYLNQSEIERLSQQLNQPLSLSTYHTQEETSPLPVSAATQFADAPTSFVRESEDVLAGVAVLNDFIGNPALILRVSMERNIYQQGLNTLTYLLLALLVAGAVSGAVVLLLVEYSVLKRLFKLSEAVSNVTKNTDLSLRVPESGQDELGSLARSINVMLRALEQSQKLLKDQAGELRITGAKAREAARIRGEFLANMSHELRTPLNAIIGFSDMLLLGMSGELSEPQKHKIQRLRENGHRLLNLINDILDISRIQAKRIELIQTPFSTRELFSRIASQIEVLATDKRLNFSASCGADMPEVIVGDEKRLEQIIVNLLSNAIKFTEKGAVTLESRPNRPDNTWNIIVSDTGIGIPPHAHETIFEEFRQIDGSSTRAFKGTGLGLAITRNLVRIMGGTISVESVLGKGSTFTVTLPLIEPIDMQHDDEIVEATMQLAGA